MLANPSANTVEHRAAVSKLINLFYFKETLQLGVQRQPSKFPRAAGVKGKATLAPPGKSNQQMATPFMHRGELVLSAPLP